jgi:hypothetical protein
VVLSRSSSTADLGADTEAAVDEAVPSYSRRTAAAVLALLLVFTATVHIGHVLRYRTLSPVDELQHLDYLIRAPRGDIPGSGDLVLQESARIQTCSRLDEGFDAVVPPCVTDENVILDIPAFQERGFNTAFIHPPTYYVVDGVLARIIDAVVPGEQSLLTTGRLAALLWSFLGVVFLWLLFAELRAGLVVRSAVIVLVVSAPMVLHGTATVNLDGTSIFFGAAMLWAVLRWERGRLTPWVPVALAGLAAGTKVNNLIAVAVAVLYLLLTEWQQRRGSEEQSDARADDTTAGWARRLPPRIRVGAAMVGAAALVSVAWLVTQRYLQVLPPTEIPMVSRFLIDRFPSTEFATAWHQTVSPLQSPYLAPFLRTQPVQVVAGFVDLALMGGAVAGLALAVRGSREKRVAVVALVLAVAVGPLLVLFNVVVQGLYVVIPPRYGLALVPALAAAAIPALRRQIGVILVSVLAAASGVAVLLAIAFPAGV